MIANSKVDNIKTSKLLVSKTIIVEKIRLKTTSQLIQKTQKF